MQREHSRVDNTTTQLKLEVQQLREEVLLSKDLCSSRQKQVDLLNEQAGVCQAKLEEVCLHTLSEE